MLRLERLNAADRLLALNTPGNRLETLKGDRRATTASASTTNGGSASSGPTDHQDRPTWKLWTIIEKATMTQILIHPGEHLADELKAIGISANELARQIAVPTNRLTQIIGGKRGISGDTACASAAGSAPARIFG